MRIPGAKYQYSTNGHYKKPMPPENRKLGNTVTSSGRALLFPSVDWRRRQNTALDTPRGYTFVRSPEGGACFCALSRGRAV